MSCCYCNENAEMQHIGKSLLKLDCVTVIIQRNKYGNHQIYATNGMRQFAGIYISFCPFCGEELDGDDDA